MRYRLITLAAVACVVGSVAIAQTSTTTTTITTEQAGKIKTYVMKEKPASVKVTERVTVGGTLPASVTLQALPPDVGMTQYRYSVVNDQTLIVDPQTRRIIQIIE